MVFFHDRVQLCGVDICSGLRSEKARKVLDLLRHKQNGAFVAYSGTRLAKEIGLSGEKGGVARLIRDLRSRITEELLDKAGIECRRHDVILSGGPGYRLNAELSVQSVEPSDDPRIQDHEALKADADGPANDPNGPNGPDPDEPDGPNDPNISAAGRRRWVLQKLGSGRQLLAPAIVQKFGCSLTTAKRDIQALKNDGHIEFVGATRTGYYRLHRPPASGQ